MEVKAGKDLACIIRERSFEGEFFVHPVCEVDDEPKLLRAGTDFRRVGDVRGRTGAVAETL
jgi:hypothetical protein